MSTRTPNWIVWWNAETVQLWQFTLLYLNIDPASVEFGPSEYNKGYPPLGLDPAQEMAYVDRFKSVRGFVSTNPHCLADTENDAVSANSRVSLRRMASAVRAGGWSLPVELLDFVIDLYEPKSQEPNWAYWKAHESWPLVDACLLVCRVNPDRYSDRDKMFLTDPRDTRTRPPWVNLSHAASAGIKSGKLISHNDLMAVNPQVFLLWAVTKDVEIPPDLEPCLKAPSETKSTDAAGNDVKVSLPYVTKDMDTLLNIMREQYGKYDPNRPPKSTQVASEIDKNMGWSPQANDKPSRNAAALAAIIRPDEIKDRRRTKR